EIKEGELPQSAETFRDAGVNYPVHCQGVVCVDVERETRLPVGEAFWTRSGIDRGNKRDDPIQIGMIAAQCIEVDAAGVVHVLRENFGPERLPFADAKIFGILRRNWRGARDQREESNTHVCRPQNLPEHPSYSRRY